MLGGTAAASTCCRILQRDRTSYAAKALPILGSLSKCRCKSLRHSKAKEPPSFCSTLRRQTATKGAGTRRHGARRAPHSSFFQTPSLGPPNGSFSRDAPGAALAFLLPTFLIPTDCKRRDRRKVGCKQLLACPFAKGSFPEIALAAKGSEIFEDCFPAFAPRCYVVDVQFNSCRFRWACAARAAGESVALKNTESKAERRIAGSPPPAVSGR